MIREVNCDDCDGVGKIDDVLCLACNGRGSYAQLDDEPAPTPAATLPEPGPPVDPRPLVSQLLVRAPSAEIEKQVKVPCMVCGKEIEIPQHVYDVVRRHNKLEDQRAQESQNEPYPYAAQFISNRQIAACTEPVNGEANPCTLAVRAQIRRASDQAHDEMRHHFDDMKKGALTFEGAQFLRRAGYAEQVKDYFDKQAKAAEAPVEKEEKPKRGKGKGKGKQAGPSLVPEPGEG